MSSSRIKKNVPVYMMVFFFAVEFGWLTFMKMDEGMLRLTMGDMKFLLDIIITLRQLHRLHIKPGTISLF